MTENMKKFLEEISGDKEFLDRVEAAETPQAMIALAAEKGFALTEEDLAAEEAAGELSDDELDEVAGGRSMPSMHKLILSRMRKIKANDLVFRGTLNGQQQASTLEFRSDESRQLNDLVNRSYGQNDDTGIVSI